MILHNFSLFLVVIIQSHPLSWVHWCVTGPPAYYVLQDICPHPELHPMCDTNHSSVSDAPFLARLHQTKGSGSSPTEIALPITFVATIAEPSDTSWFRLVGSIAAYLVLTPKHWGLAMKSPFKQTWLDGLFKHLDSSCLQYGMHVYLKPPL
jgi:hypothetical protein